MARRSRSRFRIVLCQSRVLHLPALQLGPARHLADARTLPLITNTKTKNARGLLLNPGPGHALLHVDAGRRRIREAGLELAARLAEQEEDMALHPAVVAEEEATAEIMVTGEGTEVAVGMDHREAEVADHTVGPGALARALHRTAAVAGLLATIAEDGAGLTLVLVPAHLHALVPTVPRDRPVRDPLPGAALRPDLERPLARGLTPHGHDPHVAVPTPATPESLAALIPEVEARKEANREAIAQGIEVTGACPVRAVHLGLPPAAGPLRGGENDCISLPQKASYIIEFLYILNAYAQAMQKPLAFVQSLSSLSDSIWNGLEAY